MVFLEFLLSLMATIVIEGAIMLLLFRRWDRVYFSVLCNLLTNPAANLLMLAAVQVWGADVYFFALILMEAAVIVTESFVLAALCPLRFRRALTLSLLLNAASALAGLLRMFVSCNI